MKSGKLAVFHRPLLNCSSTQTSAPTLLLPKTAVDFITFLRAIAFFSLSNLKVLGFSPSPLLSNTPNKLIL